MKHRSLTKAGCFLPSFFPSVLSLATFPSLYELGENQLGLLGFLGYMYIGRGILTGETVFAPSRWISVEGLISTLGETKVEITNRKLSSLPDVSFNLEGGNLLESLKSGNFPATRIFLLSAAQMLLQLLECSTELWCGYNDSG